MAYIYKFIDDNDQIIYIGKTNKLRKRILSHYNSNGHLEEKCYLETKKILYCELPKWDADYFEKRLINDIKPKYNKQFKPQKFDAEFKVEIPDLDFKVMSNKKFFDIYYRKNKRVLEKKEKKYKI